MTPKPETEKVAEEIVSTVLGTQVADRDILAWKKIRTVAVLLHSFAQSVKEECAKMSKLVYDKEHRTILTQWAKDHIQTLEAEVREVRASLELAQESNMVLGNQRDTLTALVARLESEKERLEKENAALLDADGEKKHDCEKWHEEGMGCALCHHSTRPVEEVKELLRHSSWHVSTLEEEKGKLEWEVTELRAHLAKLMSRHAKDKSAWHEENRKLKTERDER